MNKKLLKTFGIILGLVAFVMAFIVLGADVGDFESNKAYGGDAYTGMQNASAQAANNVMYVGETVQLGLAFILMLHGAVLLFGALCIRTGKEQAAAHAPAHAPVHQPVQPPVPQPNMPQPPMHHAAPPQPGQAPGYPPYMNK